MSDASGNRIWHFLCVVLLAIATLGFGAVGLCGAAFSVVSLPAMFSGGDGESYAVVALVISVPSLLIGGAIAWWCGRLLWRFFRAQPGVDQG